MRLPLWLPTVLALALSPACGPAHITVGFVDGGREAINEQRVDLVMTQKNDVRVDAVLKASVSEAVRSQSMHLSMRHVAVALLTQPTIVDQFNSLHLPDRMRLREAFFGLVNEQLPPSAPSGVIERRSKPEIQWLPPDPAVDDLFKWSFAQGSTSTVELRMLQRVLEESADIRSVLLDLGVDVQHLRDLVQEQSAG